MQHRPIHIGIIPDGNRRWAVQNGLNKEDGYSRGLLPGLKLLQAAKQRGIQELTYYGFTVDNCKRPKKQVEAFTNACYEAVELIKNEAAELFVCGNTNSTCFPSKLLPYTKQKNKSDDKIKVNFLVNYGWEWDMKNGWASRAIPKIDMVVRWGGMRRLSGFLPLQTVYADFYVIDDLWPDFREKHLDDALEWYARQDVTLGG